MKRVAIAGFVACGFALLTCGSLACGGTDVVGQLSENAGQGGDASIVNDGSAATDGSIAGSSGEAGGVGGGGNGGQGGAGGIGGTDSGGTGGSSDAHAAFCAGRSSHGVCTADLRARAFDHALCTCGNADGTGFLYVSSLRADGRGANVAVNSSFGLGLQPLMLGSVSGEIAGNLVIGDVGPVPIAGTTATIKGDVRLNGSLAFAGSVSIEGDAYSRDVPTGTGLLRIGGDLIVTPSLPGLPGGGAGGFGGGGFPGGGALPNNVQVAGSVRSESYPFTPECACGSAQRVDVLALVTSAVSDNDNAVLQINSQQLAAVAQSHSVSFECGRAQLSSVNVNGDLALQINGRSAIYVSGDFVVGGNVDVTLAPNAELDVLIGGRLLVDGHARFCAEQDPSRCRVYVHGGAQLGGRIADPLNAEPQASLVGNFYLPNATLQLPLDTHLHGALFSSHVLALQTLHIHHDPNVASVADSAGCDAP